jgi:GR25 family glycosyltransferase involved in LPS biosynthesis
MLQDIEAYMIVVKDSDASVYYSNYCKPYWDNYMKKVNIYDAVTPETLKKYKEIKFSKYSSQYKYRQKNINAEITETEKSCFQSHFNLWLECCFLQQPIMILEHDSILNNPQNLWYEDSYGIIFYDKASMGAYVIQPWFAKMLIEYCISGAISTGPYSIIRNLGLAHDLKNKIVNNEHKKFKSAADQVMSKKYGNTIEHYCNLFPEYWPPENFHKFIEID